MPALQLQLWPDAPAGEVDDYRLRIVLYMANYAVLHLSLLCWVGPHYQLLARQKNFDVMVVQSATLINKDEVCAVVPVFGQV